MRRNPMYMNDYIEHLDNVLSSTGEKLLVGSGKVSHAQALKKAKEEYRKYQVIEVTPVEQAYLDTIKDIEKTAKKKSREK